MAKICLHCFVSGRVQGVWYRASTEQHAKDLGLEGYAKNLADGRVEVMICGEQQQVEALRDWLWQGPPLAKVKDIEIKMLPYQSFDGFGVG